MISRRHTYGLLAGASLLLTFEACTPPPVERSDVADLPVVSLVLQEPIARFQGATAFDVAPGGVIYVTDRLANAVFVMQNGLQRVEGGPGTEIGQFDEPMDVDAGNGLVIHIADASNRRVQRFSREFRYLGSVSLTGAAFRPDERSASEARAGEGVAGRPISVTTSSTDELFVVDEVGDAVLAWDESLRPTRVIGAFGSGEGALVQPVSVTTDGTRHLYVADAAQRSIIVYDLMGSFVRRISIPGQAGPVSVSVSDGGTLVVVTSTRILLYEDHGLAEVLEPEVPESLVDAALVGDYLLVLTNRALYRTRIVR